MALRAISGATTGFGTGSADVISEEISGESTIQIKKISGEGDITDVLVGGEMYTTRQTKYGSALPALTGKVIRASLVKSNEDFMKITTESIDTTAPGA